MLAAGHRADILGKIAADDIARLRDLPGIELLLSWLPFIGDPLCLTGGIFKVGFGRFFLLVFMGKLARYAAVAWLTLEGIQMFKGG